MQIRATERRWIDVEIDQQEIRRIVRKELLAIIGLSPTNERDAGYYIGVEGELIHWEEQHTTHSWDEKRVIRKATDVDRAVLKMLKEYDNFLKEKR